jgi:glucosamine-6-phosphate deaminase
MEILVEKDYSGLSRRAAQIIGNQIKQKPNTVLGLATGSTPLGTYKELIEMHKKGLDFSRVITFNLDEYFGIPKDHLQSYNYYMFENLFNHINVKPENIHIPDGQAAQVQAYCKKYDEEIAKYGGIDLQLLGIGQNGHIGFNEPAEELLASTHLADLTYNTIQANSRFFDSIEEVPKKAITMGLGSILKAKKILLLASGSSKAKIMGELLNNDTISTKIPASLLKLHNDVTIIMDEEAAKFVKLV